MNVVIFPFTIIYTKICIPCIAYTTIHIPCIAYMAIRIQPHSGLHNYTSACCLLRYRFGTDKHTIQIYSIDNPYITQVYHLLL